MFSYPFGLTHFFVAKKYYTYYLVALLYSIFKFGVDGLQVTFSVGLFGLNIFISLLQLTYKHTYIYV